MLLPVPRGRVSGSIVDALRCDDPSLLASPSALGPDPVGDDDLQIALWTCYELHYRGFEEVDPKWEWEPQLITVRRTLEQHFLGALRRAVARAGEGRPLPLTLRELVDGDDGPSVSRYVQHHATAEQFRELLIHRSIYQLKEADPHTWAIPRLTGPAKVALIEIQMDEYGGGELTNMHSELYRLMLRELGLDDTYGGYIDVAPAVALAISNAMSLFGLRRDLLGALVGHLAAYEMTSSTPCRRYARALRRLGGSDAACRFYDEHVTADALHEQVAIHDLCGQLARSQPDLAGDIRFGAATSLYIDTRFAQHVLARWQAGRTSLYSGSAIPEPALHSAG